MRGEKFNIMDQIKDYTMNSSNFNRPKILRDQDAIYTLLIKLALLDPGTYQTHPDMGLGLLKKYRYSSDANKIKDDFKKQIETYLPMLENVEVLTEIQSHYLVIQITVDNTLYSMYLDIDKNVLVDFKS